MDLREIGLGDVDCIRLAQDRLLWVRWWTFGFLRHGVSWLVS
jgi:hypothetical protein